MTPGRCLNCSEPCEVWLWLCAACNRVKQMAYEESARVGEDFVHVVVRREEALARRLGERQGPRP